VKVLYTGGARSGKSTRALEAAQRLGETRCFVATAQALDEDMRQRIQHHQEERGAGWSTVEEPLRLAHALEQHATRADVLVVDCLTLWASNLLGAQLSNAELLQARADLVSAVERCPAHVVLVTNEVGLGIVPDNALARRYRDLLGRINQDMARACDTAVLLVAGLPLVMKGVEP
jgi:adenosylcobinamide kinase/adenosylcobinamide-phosphate guanylyltransferase